MKKDWYIVKHRKERTWIAYELTQKEANSVVDGYEIKGPYQSLISAWGFANLEYKKEDE